MKAHLSAILLSSYVNGNMKLLAFRNGVIEFEADNVKYEFRHLKMEDCIAHKLDYDFHPRDEQAIQEPERDFFGQDLCQSSSRGYSTAAEV